MYITCGSNQVRYQNLSYLEGKVPLICWFTFVYINILIYSLAVQRSSYSFRYTIFCKLSKKIRTHFLHWGISSFSKLKQKVQIQSRSSNLEVSSSSQSFMLFFYITYLSCSRMYVLVAAKRHVNKNLKYTGQREAAKLKFLCWNVLCWK